MARAFICDACLNYQTGNSAVPYKDLPIYLSDLYKNMLVTVSLESTKAGDRDSFDFDLCPTCWRAICNAAWQGESKINLRPEKAQVVLEEQNDNGA